MKKILFVTSEVYPFIKTGGLGDVAYALPKELTRKGYETRVICPLYKDIPQSYKDNMEKVCDFSVPVGWRSQYCGLYRTELDGTVFYFLDNEFYFLRGGAYGYYDDGERFAFFNRGVLEAILKMDDFDPDILHINDWHTGMIPLLMKHFYYGTKAYCKTLLTIHNLKFQGIYPKQTLTELLGLDDGYFTEDKVKYYDCISFMKAAIVFSDYVTTVSPTYALEIQNDFFGEGLNGVLSAHNYKLRGVLNGLDYEINDPKTDSKIFANYTWSKPENKVINKTELQKELGLAVDPDMPMIGIVSRMTAQKGFDLVIAMIEEMMAEKVQLVLLGTGDSKYEDVFRYYALRYPERVSANLKFSDELARKIYAGSDIFLMPSLFEPCGLGQLIALRYGSVPLVRETGGLKDTIQPYDEYKNKGNGFSFTNFNAHDMMNVIRYALKVYQDKDAWRKLLKRGMRSNYSWEIAAQNYMEIYDQLESE
ncbi:MAG: glycogen synthase GlgA [Clostridia bacterium]|nr:glycogen synthase GlgA [Clostridia bacterium]